MALYVLFGCGFSLGFLAGWAVSVLFATRG
jgi:hypothetical protein